MAVKRDKLQDFSEKLDTLKSTLYSLGIEHIEKLNIKSLKVETDKTNDKEINLKKEV